MFVKTNTSRVNIFRKMFFIPLMFKSIFPSALDAASNVHASPVQEKKTFYPFSIWTLLASRFRVSSPKHSSGDVLNEEGPWQHSLARAYFCSDHLYLAVNETLTKGNRMASVQFKPRHTFINSFSTRAVI